MTSAALTPGKSKNSMAQANEADVILLEYQSPSAVLAALPIPLFARKASWVIFSMVVAMMVASAVVPVDRVVDAPGRIISLTPSQVVQPLETSILRRILVAEGQTVKKGDLLAELDSTFTGSDTANLEAQVRSYGAQIAREQAELEGKPYLAEPGNPDSTLQALLYSQRQAEFASKFGNYQQKIASLEQKLSGAERDILAYRERLGVSREVEAMRKQLAQLEVGSKINLLAAQDQRVELERAVSNATAIAESSKNELSALIKERDAFVQNWRSMIVTDQATVLRQFNQVSEDLRKATLRRSLVQMHADEDGTILTISRLSSGAVVQAGEPLVTLMPSGAKIEVETSISSRDVGFVHVGDPVAIKFDTYIFTTFGMAEGVVKTISADSFVAPDGNSITSRSAFSGGVATGSTGASQSSNLTGVPTQLSYYRARISIDKVNLHGLGPDIRLSPGMTLTADIKVGERTILEYLFSRILPTFEEGMREP